ncbi:PCI domain-containing protein [Ditylenchus destructor]|nr:PCI domain-containing protein [Ditylenchus destructor]
MVATKTIGVLAERQEQYHLEQLRNYYVEKGVNIQKTGPEDIFANVSELLDHSNFILGLPNEKDVEMLLNSLFYQISAFSGEQARVLVEKFCHFVTDEKFQGQGWQSNAGAAVRVLSSFFHFHKNLPQLQMIEFTHLLKMAGRARLTSFLDADLEKIDEYAAYWGLDVEKKRALLRLLHSALLKDERHDAAAEVMTALLRTYAEDADQAKDDARECVRTAVIDPKSFSFDHLLRLGAVKRLEQTDQLMHEILKIFVEGTLAEYKAFVARNPNFIKDQLKVEERTMEKKIKTLTLISLAEKNQVLLLKDLQKTLDIPNEEDLENFLIDVIRVKAINGKIDEVSGKLIVTAFQYRIFDRPQWELLHQKLNTLLNGLKWAHNHIQDVNNEEHESEI